MVLAHKYRYMASQDSLADTPRQSHHQPQAKSLLVFGDRLRVEKNENKNNHRR